MKKELKNEITKTINKGIQNIKENIAGNNPKTTKVIFDKSTNKFEVDFSERGFDINGSRLSFEFLEIAISKNANIVLDKGDGLVLDNIKMNKILKYKNLY